ncbi:MAG TPA: hypothetical protein VMP89_10745 [Solirubrobacteraceae bacterium]|nr:hypothetical protein [Solirubrobacteraceae bacterium]
MKKPKRSPRASAKPDAPRATRKRRARPTPRWLTKRPGLDEMAKRRCLLVLSVLSGERPVSDVIEEAEISRPMYYQLEERALQAMLVALTPGASEPGATEPAKRIAELERKVEQLEADKRRSERLLLLTRKVLKGPMKMAVGRPRKNPASASSTSAGRRRSHASPKKAPTPSPSVPPSTPTPVGESGA